MSNRVLSRVLFALLALVSASTAFAQNAGSLRGTVADNTGAVLPGATVTSDQRGHQVHPEGVTDANGGYFFATVDPGSTPSRSTMQGFKRYEPEQRPHQRQRHASASTWCWRSARRPRRSTSPASREIIQTETGAREGVITPEQIENISIIGRNPLELLRTLPGVVAPDQGELREHGHRRPASAPPARRFSINGARADEHGRHPRRRQPARHRQQRRLDERAEQRVRGRGQGPDEQLRGRVRHGRRQRAGDHQGAAARSSTARSTTTCATTSSRPTTAPATTRARTGRRRSSSIPGFTLSGPDPRSPAPASTRTATRRSSSSASSGSADAGARTRSAAWCRRRACAQRPLQRLRRRPAPEPEHHGPNIPRGFPGAGTPAPEQYLSPYIDPVRAEAHEPVPAAELQRSRTTATTTSSTRWWTRTATRACCASTTTSPTTRAPTSAWPATRSRPRTRAASGGSPATSSCRRPSRARARPLRGR